jgi:peroxiredoxin
MPVAGPPVGQPAPDLVLPRSTVKTHRLADYRGQRRVVVTFLALAFTGGSDYGVEGTLRNFERDFDKFADRDAPILAVTAESIFVNEAFSRWLGGLRFPILADFLPRGAVSRAWDCWAEEREHPRNVTAIVDRAGIVRYSAHHQQGGMPDNRELLAALDEIEAAGLDRP